MRFESQESRVETPFPTWFGPGDMGVLNGSGLPTLDPLKFSA